MENTQATHWQCPKCNNVIEMTFDACWNCQYERTGDEVLLTDEQISPEILEDEKIPQQEIPKFPLILNVIGIFSFMFFFRYIFITFDGNYIVLTMDILWIALGLIGFSGVTSMNKLGLYLYTAFCSLGYLALFFVDEPVLLIVPLIIPTIIIIWGFINYKKMT